MQMMPGLNIKLMYMNQCFLGETSVMLTTQLINYLIIRCLYYYQLLLKTCHFLNPRLAFWLIIIISNNEQWIFVL